jgi:purine-binding chemotaxis protein CheW
MARDRGQEHRSGRRRREQRPAHAASDTTVIASGTEPRDPSGPKGGSKAGSKTGPELPDLGALSRLGPHPDVTADPALVAGLGLPDVASLLAQSLDALQPDGHAVEPRPPDLATLGAAEPELPDLAALGAAESRLPDLAALGGAAEPGLPDLSGLTAAGVDLPDLRTLPEPAALPPTDPRLPDLSGLASLPLGEAEASRPWRHPGALPAPAWELDQLGRAAIAAEGDECVVFSVGGARFAVPLHNVAQVGEVGHVTRVPNTPDWIVGVISWRDDVISLIDVPTLLGRPSDVPGGHVVVIRTDDGDMAAGLLVERLGRIERYPHDQFDDVLPDGSLGRIAGGAYRPEASAEVVAVDVERLLAAAWPEALGAGA